MISQKKLVNFTLSTGSYESFVNEIISLAKARKSEYISVANVHMFVTTQKDDSFRKIVNESAIVTPDGKPLAWALKLFGGRKQERVAGMDLVPSLIEASAQVGVSVYFYGSSTEIVQAVIRRAKKNFPALGIAGSYSPPFRQLTDAENEEIIAMINEARPQLVFVALGCPKQEKWMAAMKGKIHATMIGIGGALPVYAGVQKRAPVWMQKNGLEWFYRFIQEPRRLFKRYAITNSEFAYIIAKEYFARKFSFKKKMYVHNPPLLKKQKQTV